VPLLGCLVFAYFYLQETPQFLIKQHTVEEIEVSMRFMAKQNGRETECKDSYILSKANLELLKEEYER
jgi:hypothetical protein